MRKNWSKGQKGPERENYWKDMSGYFLSPSGQKDGLGKKLITTWEGRELVTWLFLKIYHPLSHEKPDKEGKCHLLIKKGHSLTFSKLYFSENLSHFVSGRTGEKRKMPLEKTKISRKEGKCHLLKKGRNVYIFRIGFSAAPLYCLFNPQVLIFCN